MNVSARMYCQSKTLHDSGYATVKLCAVYGKNGESNKDFADATPTANLELTISKGRPAMDVFVPGKTYDLLFTPVE